ncbi:MAG: diguanylate cyclase [Sphingomicrobium sp.]
MTSARTTIQCAGVALAYFSLASLAISTTRFDGGLAFVWFANAYLIGLLLRLKRRDWLAPVLCGGLGSMLATGLVGASWALSPFLALANIAEVLVAAWLMRRARSSLMQLGSIRWTKNLFWAAGIAGPLAMAAVAILPMWFFSGILPVETLFRALTGHGLSNLTFIPIVKLFVTGGHGNWRDRGERFSAERDLPMFALLIGVTSLVFMQRSLPLLFLPILPLTVIVFNGGSRRSAVALCLLALIGGACTLLGLGPISLAVMSHGLEMQFMQFFLLATTLTIVPIAAQLRSRRLLAQQVRDSEARYRMLADHSSDIITHTDLTGRALFVSNSMTRIAGYEPRVVIGRNIMEFIDVADQAGVAEAYGRAIVSGGEAVRMEYRARVSSGEWVWFESLCRGVVGDDGRVEGLVSIVRDISNRKQREDDLAVAATIDCLTGLRNRRAFRDAALHLKGDERDEQTAIALLDIDFFKRVNDSLGHAAGDEVLIAFAGIAQRLLRRRDVLARVGGEEFAILFPGLDQAAAAKVCNRIRGVVGRTPFCTAGGHVAITISGGVATLGADGLDAALRRADKALYDAKANGRDCLALAA